MVAGSQIHPETDMAKKNKVPRKIAGVKLTKPLRRGLRDLASSQTGREALTEALDAVGAALAASQQPEPAAKPRKSAAAEAPKADGPDVAAEARAATMAALEDATRSFTDALKRRGPTETPPPAAAATPPTASTH